MSNVPNTTGDPNKTQVDWTQVSKFDSNRMKEIKNEIFEYFISKDYCTIYDSSSEEAFGNSAGVNLRIKIRNYPISLHLHIDCYGYTYRRELQIKTILGGSNSAISCSTYRIEGSNYLEKLETHIQKIMDAFNKYIKFIQDIQNHFEEQNNTNLDYSIDTLVDLNQYYLYLRYGNKIVVVYPTFAIENDKIIIEAYIGNTDSHHHSMIYVNSANMEDVYSTVDFFL